MAIHAVWGWLWIGVIAALFGLILFMFVSLARQGDERRKLIVSKSIAATFYFTLFTVAADLILSMPEQGQGVPPLLQLVLIACFFTVALSVCKKKYGD